VIRRNPIGRSRKMVVVMPALVLLGLVMSRPPALAGDPPTEPFLRLETGMHTAPILGISVDAAAHLLLTVSEDKTARLWSLDDGRLIRVLRPPIGAGDEGMLYAGALSPDGRIAAVGGSTGLNWDDSSSVYLFDTGSGRLLRRLPGLPRTIHSLAVSPDGQFLAAGLGGGAGIRIWHTTDWASAWDDRAYGESVYGLSFSKSGDLVTSSWDGYLRINDAQGHLMQPKVKAPGGSRPHGVAVSPDGKQVAVGYEDSNRVDVLSGHDLRLLLTPGLKGINESMAYVAWSARGDTLFAGENSTDVQGRKFIRAWSNGGRGAYRDAPVGVRTIMNLLALPHGDVVFAAADPRWGVLRGAGRIDLLHIAEVADYPVRDHFRVTPDGKEVQFAFDQFGKRPAAFVLPDRRLITDPPDNAELTAPRTSGPGMTVDHWQSEPNPTLNGVALNLVSHERATAVAINGEHLLLGADVSLRLFDKAGSQVWSVDAPGVARAVNITRDGRLALAAFDDGTIRWFRMENGRELLALFPDVDGKRWVAWTPQGYYDASVGGDELIGWHVNRGADKEADFFPAGQFRDRFNRPDIVALVLDTLDVDEAVRQANSASGRKTPSKVGDNLPPVVKILSPPDLASVAKSPIEVTYLVRSPTPVTGMTVLVDGRPVETAPPTPINSGSSGIVASLSIDMPQHNAAISLVAANEKASSEAAIVHVGWQGAKDWYKPDLYVLAVGVSNYKDKSLKLIYPEKDAEDFVKVIQPQEGQGRLYGHVYYHDLAGEHATREEIRKGLSWLKKSTTARDIAVLFLSGHGQNDAGGHYHYLPYDADLSDLDLTTVQDFEIEDFLAKVPGKVVAFLDTCFSGGLHPAKGPTQPDIDALANRLASAEKGIVVFTSSTGRQFSLEKPEWNNGAFTKALVEAVRGGPITSTTRRSRSPHWRCIWRAVSKS
jgi:WD40 repeat protein